MDYHQILADYVSKQSYSGNMIETYRCGGIASALADAYYEVAECVEHTNGQCVYHMIPGAIGYNRCTLYMHEELNKSVSDRYDT